MAKKISGDRRVLGDRSPRNAKTKTTKPRKHRAKHKNKTGGLLSPTRVTEGDRSPPPTLPEPYASGLVPADRAGPFCGAINVQPEDPGKTRASRSVVEPERVAYEVIDTEDGPTLLIRDPVTFALFKEWTARRVEMADKLTLDLLHGLVGQTFTLDLCNQVRERCRKAMRDCTALASVAMPAVEKAAKAFKVKGPQDGQPEIDAQIYAAVEAEKEAFQCSLTVAFEKVSDRGDFLLTPKGIDAAYYRHNKRRQ